MNDEEVAYQDPRSKAQNDRFDIWGTNWPGAVLNADEIRFYCAPPVRLIEDMDEKNLKAASYRLALGEEIHVGGEHRTIGNHGIILEPHQVAVVETKEKLRIPRFLIGRWSLRVSKIYEGLLWTGGLQVDPGWTGRLYCPIYNLSEKRVRLKREEAFFTIDFVRVTPMLSGNHVDPGVAHSPREDSKAERERMKWFEPVRKTLAEHDSNRLHSAPYEALKEVKQLQEFRIFSTFFILATIAVLTLVVGALSIMAAGPYIKQFDPPFDPVSLWSIAKAALSPAAFILSLGAVWISWRTWSKNRG